MIIALPYQLDGIMTPISPFGNEADRHALQWAEKHGLVRTAEAYMRLSRTRPGMLAAHCYPRADLSELCLLADWMSWLFILDDHNDEGPYGWDPESLENGLALVFSAVIGSHTAGNLFGAALADMVEQFGERMSAGWRNRFLHHVVDYFRAYVWQAAQRREKTISDLDVFPRLRRDAGAIMPSFDLVEFIESSTLPPSLYYSRAFQRLLVAAANVVCWTNDIMTIEKEMARGDNQNFVAVVREATRVSLDQAVADVADRTGREIESFLAAEADLPRTFTALLLGDEQRVKALACVETLKAWMRGHVDWGKETARYVEFGGSATPEYFDDLLVARPAALKKA